MSANTIALSIVLLAIAIAIAKWIRIRFKIFSKIFLPTSVIAGFLVLLLGPEVLGKVISREYGVFTEDILTVFKALPGLLITVIFAGLFIGKNIPDIKEIWHIAGPQVSFGQSIAWGQYVVGGLVTLFILVPVFGANPMSAALIEIAFEGGHGTAAGLAETFFDLGFEEGADLALGLATVGVVFGVLFGIVLINWGKHKHTVFLKSKEGLDQTDTSGIIPEEDRTAGSIMTVSTESVEPFALHLGIIALAIALGIGLLEGLTLLENATWGKSGNILIIRYLPLFPLAMIGGVIVQIFLQKFDKRKIIDRKTIVRLQGLALDFLIVSAIGSLSLAIIGSNFEIFLILSITGILWNLFMFIVLARRMLPKYWFERGIGDFGQSMGMTAIGIMLIRIADPNHRSRAMEAFGYKQLLFEPFVGGGIMTAISVPLIAQLGLVTVIIISASIMSIWLFVGLVYFGRKGPEQVL